MLLNVTNPHLNSFPTRRSSDLGGTKFVGSLNERCQATVRSRTTCEATGSALRNDSARHHSRYVAVPTRSMSGCVCDACADRKSTRLNSSHLVISYAVFCLKKKK